ncbi:hypothetical protein ACTHOQ_00460 [Solibacillus silvestris]|uniref:hypothetical protein n=1 Tax=Solibacillus silvestris TaxID=76853 RepID=UPI003F816C01
MFNDLSLLGQINGLINPAYYQAKSASFTGGTSANFEDYLMNALNNKEKTTGTNSGALFELLSSSSATPLLNGLNSTENTNDFASILIRNLQQPQKENFYMSDYNNVDHSLTQSYAGGLMNNFQAQMLNSMNAAKEKLQSSYSSYVERAGENPNAAAKLRIEQMQKNIGHIEQFIQSKTANNENALLQQLNAKSSLTQHLLER